MVNGTSAGHSAKGGGAFLGSGFVLAQSIISLISVTANIRAGPDVYNPSSFAQLRYNLIGNNFGTALASAPVGTPDANGNLIGNAAASIDPMIGALANNGGPTKTHALLQGGPAIDGGDPAALAGLRSVPKFDQRGTPLSRVIDGDGTGLPRMDIGAFELHLLPPLTPILLGDYNLNGAVDAADYVVWRKTLGTGGLPAFSVADGNGNGAIDQPDHGVWRVNFGNVPPPGAGSGAGYASSVVSRQLQAEAVSMRSISAGQVGESVVRIRTDPMSAFAKTDAAAARSASFAVLETRSFWHDSGTWSRRTIHRYQVAESGGDDVPLLLAIDRVGRSPRQDSLVNDHRGKGKHRADDGDSESDIDEPLAVALAVWGRARSTCIVPG